jgi:pantoate--beta-alanine ligase
VEEVYPSGFATTIHVAGITDVLDGAHRGSHHFDGVATVVTKLFQMVGPDAAYFGQKDAQQVLVIRRLARDLDMPVRIVACPIVREPDGLAMSSRNVYLDAAARQQATALNRALDAAETTVRSGETGADAVIAAARTVLTGAGIEPEYLELRSAEDLAELDRVDGQALLAVAARVGAARLIDNRILEATP